MSAQLEVAEPEIVIPQEILASEKLRVSGDYEGALKIASKFLDDNYDNFGAIATIANILIDTKRFGLAATLMQRAVQLQPNNATMWMNLGICYEEMEHLEDAEKYFLKALSRNPNDSLCLSNLAALYIKKSEPQKALNCAEKAVRLNPNEPLIRTNISQANLMLGNWKEGWSSYDYNIGRGRKDRTYGNIPRWTGVKGLNLVCHGEQGIGDEISFASCIPDLMRDNKVVIECDHRLQGLFMRSFNCPVYGTLYFNGGLYWPKEYDFDAKVGIGSLPGFYRNSDEDFPGTPYLVADPERRIQWRALLDSLGDKPKIGIAWSGGIKKTCTDHRSIDIKEMLPILRQDATFISLQYKPAPELLDLYKEHGIAVHHWARAMETQDYDDTAALVAELDLVITVQQSVVHLAGGLGVPCWAMVPTVGALWRYGVKGSGFPWAKSVKLYRQHGNTGGWVHTISEVATDLRNHIKERA